jgi:nucleoside-diphosphate-sugar epimerase
MDKKVNVLITGGSGFLGKALLKELFASGSPINPGIVRVLDLIRVPEEFAGKVEMIEGDVRDPDLVNKALNGMDSVIHTAAIVDWGVRSEQEVLDVNVQGTKNVIAACRSNKVPYMVHTSSLDAVYSGKPLVNIDEEQPYPEKHETTYCKSKYLSELAVIAANNETLSTCVLRPSDIYGEMDPYHIGSLIDMAKGGFYIRLGNGKSNCQHVYVGNMAYALLKAAAALMVTGSAVKGQVYFITDGKGSNFFKFFDQIVAGAGYRIRPKNLWLPRGVAYFLASISEGIAWLAKPIKKYNPKFSRFAVTYTSTDFTFTSEKAKKDFNYEPKYATEVALERTIAFYRAERERQ